MQSSMQQQQVLGAHRRSLAASPAAVTRRHGQRPSCNCSLSTMPGSRASHSRHNQPYNSWQSTPKCSRSALSAAAADTPSALAPAGSSSSPPQPILIGINCDVAATARALVAQVKQHGSAEVWATSSANQYSSMMVLARAQELMAGPGAGPALCTLAGWQQHDFEHDDQKRRLRKLCMYVRQTAPQWSLAKAAEPASSSSSSPSGQQLSAMRTREPRELSRALEQQLSGSSRTASVEARGEQAVSRALKALLWLQSAREIALPLVVMACPVVDVAAEKRGEERMVPGLRLLVDLDCVDNSAAADGSESS